MYYLTSPTASAIRKIDSSNNLVWMSSISDQTTKKGISVDSVEQYLYVLIYSGNANVVRMNATDGSFSAKVY